MSFRKAPAGFLVGCIALFLGVGLQPAEASDALWKVLTLQQYNTRLVVLSTTLLGITAGVIGTFLLLRKRSLMGDAISHATLPGIGIAFLVMVGLGGEGKWLPGLLLGATVSGLLGVLVVLAILRTTRLGEDAAMGIVLSVFFGLGVVVLGLVQSMPRASAAGLESFIYGKTASVVIQDFHLILWVTLAVTLVSLAFLKEFTLLCFDDHYAASQGWPTLLLEGILLTLVMAVTVIGLQSVGLILIIAFLITPATSARFWTRRLHAMLWISAALGGLSGWLGASLSAVFPRLPAGAVIVLVAAGGFAFSLFFGTERGVLARYRRHAGLRRKIGRQHLLRAFYEILESGRADGRGPVSNLPVPYASLQAKRSWSPSDLRGLLRTARQEDHLAPAPTASLQLSEEGFGEAARVTRNHRLWELYLIRHADIAPSHVDRDADLVEHILGPEMVRQLEEELARGPRVPAMPTSPHSLDPREEGAS